MFGQQTTLEWQVGLDEDWETLEWEDLPTEPAPTVARRPAPRRLSTLQGLLRNLLLLLLLALIVVGYSVVQDYQAGIRRIRREIQGTLDLEAWAWLTRDMSLREQLLDGQVDEGWAYNFNWRLNQRREWAGSEARATVTTIRNVELRDDLALVEILASQPGEPWATTPYRETRFYRRVDGRWLRTAPVAAMWGGPRTLKTRYFRFAYHQRDAVAVQTVAATIDRRYLQLRQEVGLPPPPEGEVLDIRVMPTTNVVYWRFSGDRLTVPAPALLPIPVDTPDATRLTWSIWRPLVRRVMSEVQDTYAIPSQWDLLLEGLELWLGWSEGGLPSAWYYHSENLLGKFVAGGTPLRLIDLSHPGWNRWSREPTAVSDAPPQMRDGWWDDANRWARIVAAEGMVDYIVQAYGRDLLPALVQGLGAYPTWETLVPAVFPTTPQAFEAGYQLYLSQRFLMPASAPDQDTAN